MLDNDSVSGTDSVYDNDIITKSCKVCLLGNSGSGKSSIIERLINNDFTEDSQSTTCSNYSKKVINTQSGEIQLNIWDTAGQEKYRSLSKLFYKDAYIVCFVYDITQKSSFEDIKNIWFPDLQKFGEKYTVLGLTGSKSDKYLEQEVTEEEGRKYAEEIDAIFMQTSAKNGTGINQLFEQLAFEYYKPEFSDLVDQLVDRKKGSFSFKSTNNKNYKKKKHDCCN